MKKTHICLIAMIALTGCATPHNRIPQPLSETGQATFAALEEAVIALQADPNTDWDRVDVDGLREHLLDMDRVTMMTSVESVDLSDGVRHRVTAEGDALGSLHRMSEAHADFMARELDWDMAITLLDSGISLDIRPASEADIARVRALGFYGWIALGGHHQVHHWAMVSGRDPHQHNH